MNIIIKPHYADVLAGLLDPVLNCPELVLGVILRRRRCRAAKKSLRCSWVRPILHKRWQQGEYNNLSQEMRFSDRENHFSFLRMSKEMFDLRLKKVRV